MLGKGIWRFKGRVFGLYSCFFLPKKKKTLAFLERKKKRGSHPPLPSQRHKGRNGQQRSFQFPALSLLTSGEREEEAPVNEARFHPLTPTLLN